MKFIDVSVPLDGNLASYPGNTPFTLEPIKRIANGDSSKRSRSFTTTPSCRR